MSEIDELLRAMPTEGPVLVRILWKVPELTNTRTLDPITKDIELPGPSMDEIIELDQVLSYAPRPGWADLAHGRLLAYGRTRSQPNDLLDLTIEFIEATGMLEDLTAVPLAILWASDPRLEDAHPSFRYQNIYGVTIADVRTPEETRIDFSQRAQTATVELSAARYRLLETAPSRLGF